MKSPFMQFAGDGFEEETVLLNTLKPVNPKNDDVTPTGKVVGIIRRKWRQYCGILVQSKFAGEPLFKYKCKGLVVL